MPRKRTEISVELLEKLKQQLFDQSSVTIIRSVDCDKFAEIVSHQTKCCINGISFKRLFGFTKYPFNPSIQTLDICCQFVGFDGWYAFEQYHTDKKMISKNEFEIYASFFDLDFVNDVLPHEGAFQSVARKIAHRFREDPKMLIRQLPVLMQKKQFQVFFAEHFPDYDNLCSYYYKVYESYLAHKKTPEARIFGNSMLFLKSFWLLDEDNCTKYLNEINLNKLDDTIHPYVIGRYYACNFLFDSFFNNGNQFHKYYLEYTSMRNTLTKHGKHFFDFPASEYIVSEALLHCNRFEQCIEIIDLASLEFSLRMEFVRKGYYRQMQLFRLIAVREINPSEDINNQLSKINPNNFYFISEMYFKALFHYASLTDEDLSTAELIATEMGNFYLMTKFSNRLRKIKEKRQAEKPGGLMGGMG
jgi:hypothetical protein